MAVSPALRSLTLAGLAAVIFAGGVYASSALWYFNDFKLPF
jgi:hypothetical protein